MFGLQWGLWKLSSLTLTDTTFLVLASLPSVSNWHQPFKPQRITLHSFFLLCWLAVLSHSVVECIVYIVVFQRLAAIWSPFHLAFQKTGQTWGARNDNHCYDYAPWTVSIDFPNFTLTPKISSTHTHSSGSGVHREVYPAPSSHTDFPPLHAGVFPIPADNFFILHKIQRGRREKHDASPLNKNKIETKGDFSFCISGDSLGVRRVNTESNTTSRTLRAYCINASEKCQSLS